MWPYVISFHMCVCVCLVFLTESSKEHQSLLSQVRNTRYIHTQTDCNDIRPQTTQFYNKRISTDPILVTWQSTVYEPPEDGFKKRPKHVGACGKGF